MFSKFSSILVNRGFTPSTADNSLFIKSSGNSFIALLVCVDDIVIASNDQRLVDDLKGFLDSCFKLKDLERLKYFLGLEVARSSRISLRYRLSCPQNQENSHGSQP